MIVVYIFQWMVKHYKVAIALTGALVTFLFFPVGGFVLMTKKVEAKVNELVKENEIRRTEIVVLDTKFSGMKAVLDRIEQSQIRSEERVFRELQEARQKRLAGQNP